MPVFLKSIRNELLKYPRNPNKYPYLPIKNVNSLASPDLNSVMFKATVLGESEESDNYLDYIQFFKVEFSEHKDKEFSVPVRSEGRLLYYKKPSVAKNPVFLRCSCPDFQFRWMYPLHKNDALVGKPIPYSGYPSDRPVNPKELMGFCKHIFSMLRSLRDSDQITE